MGWTWWLVHKDTPDEQTRILRDAMKSVMQREDVRQKIEQVGFVPLDWDHDDYDEVVGSVARQFSEMGDALKWEEEQLLKLK